MNKIGTAASLGVYAYVNLHIIEEESKISQAEQYTARVQSFARRAQDALNSGQYTYEQWRQMFDPEVEQLNRDHPTAIFIVYRRR